MDLQQVKTDLENGVLVSPSTWLQVLETALELRGKQDALVALVETAANQTVAWQKKRREFLTSHAAATES